MTELKTLKDLDKGWTRVSKALLKAEAIKWEKYKNKGGGISILDWREFFNITSEDLE